jgi:hypothetical protein
MRLSSERSATRRFNFAFSSRSWRSSRISVPPQLAYFFSDVESRFADAHLPADIRHRGAAIALPQRTGDLLVGEPRALHGPLLPLAFSACPRRTCEATSVQL